MPDAGQQTRTIKALPDEDVAALFKGEAMGLAKEAELNGYPGPAYVLPLALQPGFSGGLTRQVSVIFDRMAAAEQLGADLVEHKRLLDRQFASGLTRV